jgi:hypothetical protein
VFHYVTLAELESSVQLSSSLRQPVLQKLNNICIIKSSRSKLISTRRSTVLSGVFPFSKGSLASPTSDYSYEHGGTNTPAYFRRRRRKSLLRTSPGGTSCQMRNYFRSGVHFMKTFPLHHRQGGQVSYRLPLANHLSLV